MNNTTILRIPVSFQIDPDGKSVDMMLKLLKDTTEELCKNAFGLNGSSFDTYDGEKYTTTYEFNAYDKDGKYEHNFGFRKQLQEEVWVRWDGETPIEVVDLVPVIILHNYDPEETEDVEGALHQDFYDALHGWTFEARRGDVQLNDYVSVTLVREEG